VGIRKRLDRLEARTPVVRTEEEIRAAACRRMSTEDLTVLEETLHRLEEMGADELGWEELSGELPEEERDAFEQAYARYEEAMREARAER
jgi:hypothetical protein